MRWLYKLEYKFGRYYIRNLIPILVGAMAVVYVADLALGGAVSGWLFFFRPYVLGGQVWRALTFLFVPPSGSWLPNVAGLGFANAALNPLFVALSLYFTFIAGRMLESMWSGFRLNLYYLIGFLGALVAGFVSPVGIATNSYLNASLFLAVATLMPEAQFRMFLLIPIKGLWFAIAFLLFDVIDIVRAFMGSSILGLNALILFAFSLIAYLVFCGPTLWRLIGERLRIAKNRRAWRGQNRR